MRGAAVATDAEVAKYFEDHKESYRIGEKRKVRYLLIDQEALRKYFPTTPAVRWMLDISERLYGIRFERADVPAWHDEVIYYDVRDAESGAFIGPHVCFTNDLYPRAVDDNGELLTGDDWEIVRTIVKKGAAIGANATIICGVTVGEGAMVGAGSVVTKDVPPRRLVRGNPARDVGPRPG